MRVIVGNSENLSLISSRYIVWKYRDFLQLPCVLLPPLGTILAMVIEVRKCLSILNKMNKLKPISQSLVPRHTLDISMKYSYVPQTEAPYKMDRYSPVDWSASEPEKVMVILMMAIVSMMIMMLQVTVLMPSTRFLLPRDSLSKIVTGQVTLSSHWSTLLILCCHLPG